MPDEKIKITKGTPSHTLGERLKFEVINPISKNEGYYLWNVFNCNNDEKQWKPIRTINGKSYKFECHFEKESSDGVTFQVRVYKNDKKPEIEENTLLDFIEVTPHKRIEKAPKIISTHFFPEGEYDTNNKVSVYDSLHLRAKTEGLTGKEIQFHVCQEENGKEIVKDTVSARVDHTDYATTKIKLPIDTIKSILTNKNQENQKDYYIKASFGLDKNGKKSTGEITKTYFIDKQGNPIEKISIGDTIRVCIDSKGEIADFLQYTIYEKDKHTSDDVIFQSPKFKLNNNHFFCREIVVTKELFNKGYGVSHTAFDSDYNVQDYYIKVERFSGSANSHTFEVTSNILKVHYGISPVKVYIDDDKDKLPMITGVEANPEEGVLSIYPNTKIHCKVTSYNISRDKISNDKKKNISWLLSVDNNSEFLPQKGEEIELIIKENWGGKEIKLIPFLNGHKADVSIKLKIEEHQRQWRAWIFVVADELLPREKLIRKDIPNTFESNYEKFSSSIKEKLPTNSRRYIAIPNNKIRAFFDNFPTKIPEHLKSHYAEKGLKVPNIHSDITISQHVSNKLYSAKSAYISASTLENGAPTISGEKYYLDVKKLKKAGCKIYTTEEILQALEQEYGESIKKGENGYIKHLKEVIENVEKEVLIKGEPKEGKIPKSAIKSANSMKMNNVGRVLNVLGIVITIVELEEAAEKSIEKESFKPIVAESIRQAGGWSGALITATAWGSYAAASTSISGPWAIVIGFAASLVGGFLGYFFSDKVADHIDEN